jgi:hypothetical protein
MKKLYAAAAVFGLAVSMLCAQTDVSQSTLPKKIYVGDTVELRYTFRSAADFFADKDKSAVSRDIPVKALQFEIETDDYTVEKASLERSGLQYTFCLTFVPWRTGAVDFPPVDIARAVYGKTVPSFSIVLQSVTVSSILRSPDDTSLRLPAGPLLLPGTVYVLYAAAVALVIIIIIIIRMIVMWPAIRSARKEKRLLRSYARNAKDLLKGLRRLEKSGMQTDGRSFCTELQQLIRRYLDFRYGYHFSSVLTPQFMAAFNAVTAGTLSEKKQHAAELLTSVMSRSDYIRYAHGSLDAERQPADQYDTTLGSEERGRLLSMVREAVRDFEEVV